MANRLAHFTTNLGDFQVELFEGRAPDTTKNFIDLVEKGLLRRNRLPPCDRRFHAPGGLP